MIGRALGTALPVLLVLLGGPPRAEAQDRAPTVVLGADVPGDAVVSRMYDELVAMGVRVEIAPPESTTDALRELGRARGAEAVVHVSGGEVSVFARDATAPRHVPAGEDPATTALAAAEVLRGHIVGPSPERAAASDESAERVAEVSAEPDPGPPAAAERERDAPSATLRAGPALLLSPGGVPDQLALAVGAALLLGRAHLALDAHIGVPGITLTGKRGDVPIWTSTLGVGAGYSLLPRDSAFGLGAGFGVAMLAIVFEERNETSVVVAALPHLRLVTRLVVSAAVALRADATAGYALPAPDIEIKGRNPTFGQPLVAFALSIEVGW